jgi:hypothetical protein
MTMEGLFAKSAGNRLVGPVANMGFVQQQREDRERTTFPAKKIATQMEMSKTDNASAPRQASSANSDSGI